jgi:hypothetical protein
MERLTEANEQVAGRLPASLSRFRRLPPVADCAVSTYPAEHRRRIGVGHELASEVSYRKHRAGQSAWAQRSQEFIRRLRDGAPTEVNYRFSENLDSLAEALSVDTTSSGDHSGEPGGRSTDPTVGWLAVVHIDGSGIGKVFIEQSAQSARAVGGSGRSATERHLELYFALSLGLDEATSAAFTAALAAVVREDGLIPVVPLVVGGDDVTAVCLGRDALRFVEAYLSTFEQRTTDIARELKSLMHPDAAVPESFSACAGVAIVKPQYPFHLAYDLAEELIANAKASVKAAVAATDAIPSAYDVHVLNDSGAVSLAGVRAQRRSRLDGIELWGGPYVVGAAPTESHLRTHDWLVDAIDGVATVTQTAGPAGVSDEARAARSSLNRVKEALFEGRAEAVRARGEMVGGLPDALRDDLVAVLDHDPARQSSGLADVLDLFDIADIDASGGGR